MDSNIPLLPRLPFFTLLFWIEQRLNNNLEGINLQYLTSIDKFLSKLEGNDNRPNQKSNNSFITKERALVFSHENRSVPSKDSISLDRLASVNSKRNVQPKEELVQKETPSFGIYTPPHKSPLEPSAYTTPQWRKAFEEAKQKINFSCTNKRFDGLHK